MEMAKGMMISVKAMVSSLMPNTDPNRLNKIMIMVMTMLFTPIFRIHLRRSSFWVKPKNAMMPVSMALLLFMIQKAPPQSG
jgi:hypothetical protein